MTASPTFAVVVAVRNGEAFIARALESLVRQTRPPDEVIVVDDGSEDRTSEIIDRFQERLALRRVSRSKQGIAAARNVGNAAASSEWIVVLDADDELLPDAIAAYARAVPSGGDFFYADCIAVRGRWRKRYRYPAFGRPEALAWRTLTAFFVPFKHSATCYRRAAVSALGGYDETLPRKVDVELVLRANAAGLKIVHLDDLVCVHHKHGAQTSVRRRTGLLEWRLLIDRYLSDHPFQHRIAVVRRTVAEWIKGALGA